jgi:peptidoglycan/xylan/chitin deacetylase (PgdA/CDA1 family)
MKRWNRETVGRAFKHTAVSLLVCGVVLLLPLLGLKQWHSVFGLTNTNQATPLPAFANRSVDSADLPELFKQPLISITFDDGWETTYSVAAPLLMQNGIHSTQYVTTGLIGDPAYLSLDQVKALKNNGQQIACHTVTHPDLTTVDRTKLDSELSGCQQYFLKNNLGKTVDFAAPYGHTNSSVNNEVKKYFRSGRNTNGDITNGMTDADVNLPNTVNQYEIIGVTVHSDTTVEQLQNAVDYTIAHNGWLVLTYHQAEEAGSKFSLSSASLQKQLSYLSSTNVRIVTVGQVMDGLAAKYK